MDSVTFYSVTATVVVSLVSLIGVITLSFKRRFLDRILFFLISLSAGALLGDVFFHLLPELVEEVGGFTLFISVLILVGFLAFFLLEKTILWHHHHIVETPEEHEKGSHSHTRSLGLMNLVGDGFHNLLDGMIIAASFMISPSVGVGTTVAVILHEIPQEVGDFGVLIHSGYSVRKALLFNFLSAALAIVGALVTLSIGSTSEVFLDYLVPLVAGGFIYIAASDLIPELKKKDGVKDTLRQLVVLLIGMGLMYGLLFVELEGHGYGDQAIEMEKAIGNDFKEVSDEHGHE
jgi:zinc and cadmium transporter